MHPWCGYIARLFAALSWWLDQTWLRWEWEGQGGRQQGHKREQEQEGKEASQARSRRASATRSTSTIRRRFPVFLTRRAVWGGPAEGLLRPSLLRSRRMESDSRVWVDILSGRWRERSWKHSSQGMQGKKKLTLLDLKGARGVGLRSTFENLQTAIAMRGVQDTSLSLFVRFCRLVEVLKSLFCILLHLFLHDLQWSWAHFPALLFYICRGFQILQCKITRKPHMRSGGCNTLSDSDIWQSILRPVVTAHDTYYPLKLNHDIYINEASDLSFAHEKRETLQGRLQVKFTLIASCRDSTERCVGKWWLSRKMR